MTCVPAFSVPCLLSPCHWLLIALHLRQRPSAFLGRSAWIYQLAAHSTSSINFSTGVIHRARQNLRLRSSILILFLSFQEFNVPESPILVSPHMHLQVLFLLPRIRVSLDVD